MATYLQKLKSASSYHKQNKNSTRNINVELILYLFTRNNRIVSLFTMCKSKGLSENNTTQKHYYFIHVDAQRRRMKPQKNI